MGILTWAGSQKGGHCAMAPPLVPNRIMHKTNNCLKISWQRWTSCQRLTQELQILYGFLDVKQKSQEQVFCARVLQQQPIGVRRVAQETLCNIESNI